MREFKYSGFTRKDMPSGHVVYQIRNMKNGKVYIGTSLNLKRRLGEHQSLLRHGKHINKGMQMDARKHGLDSFDVCVLEICKDFRSMRVAEEQYMDQSQNLYNMVPAHVPLPDYEKVEITYSDETLRQITELYPDDKTFLTRLFNRGKN